MADNGKGTETQEQDETKQVETEQELLNRIREKYGINIIIPPKLKPNKPQGTNEKEFTPQDIAERQREIERLRIETEKGYSTTDFIKMKGLRDMHPNPKVTDDVKYVFDTKASERFAHSLFEIIPPAQRYHYDRILESRVSAIPEDLETLIGKNYISSLDKLKEKSRQVEKNVRTTYEKLVQVRSDANTEYDTLDQKAQELETEQGKIQRDIEDMRADVKTLSNSKNFKLKYALPELQQKLDETVTRYQSMELEYEDIGVRMLIKMNSVNTYANAENDIKMILSHVQRRRVQAEQTADLVKQQILVNNTIKNVYNLPLDYGDMSHDVMSFLQSSEKIIDGMKTIFLNKDVDGNRALNGWFLGKSSQRKNDYESSPTGNFERIRSFIDEVRSNKESADNARII